MLSCDAAKKVPNGGYLLNKVKIDTDTKGIGESDLKPYLRQQPNSSIPVLGKVKLHIYNISKNDYTWLNRQFIKYGEPPVLYSDRLTGISMEQIQLELNNRGYLNAEVDTVVRKKNRKADVVYRIKGHEPYSVRTFKDSVRAVDSTVFKILDEQKRFNLIREGDVFDLEELEKLRIQITNDLRNNGYYNFSKENFYYLADTTVGSHGVDLTLGLNNPTDSTRHKRYLFGEVIVNNGVDSDILQDSSRHSLLDTIDYKGIKVVQERNKFMLPQAIFYNTFIRPGRVYSDRLVERTYSWLNRLGSVSQTAINLTPVAVNDSNFINANISIFPGNVHFMQFGIDGTNSAGDLGVAADVTYEHKNFLKGAETFRLKINGAYEFIGASSNIDKSYYEYGTEAFLSIPQLLLPWVMKQLKDQPSASTEFSLGVNFQNRSEYLRQFFNLSSRLQWSRRNWQIINLVEPLAVTYVRMPRMSEKFRRTYMNDSINPILKASYDEQLIVRSAYSVTYTNIASAQSPPRFPYRIRAGVEVAGYLPRLVSAVGGAKKSRSGRNLILGLPYAEYVKADLDFAPAYRFDDKNTLAAHFAVGVAYPYGNSIVLPFEKRYYGGGANSVRGWSTRTLGPGTYRNDSLGYDFANKTGDIKLDMSIEFRRKLTKLFELAAFVDAGNVWTVKNYRSQPGGYFRWSRFYRELAAAYGLGMRVDLNFLLLRVDLGMKAYNPAEAKGERWRVFNPDFKRDFAFHFAIGYPF